MVYRIPGALRITCCLWDLAVHIVKIKDAKIGEFISL